jgi:hypothetical protein
VGLHVGEVTTAWMEIRMKPVGIKRYAPVEDEGAEEHEDE